MKQTTIRLPEELYKKLQREAKRNGVSVNAWMIMKLRREAVQ